MRYNLLKIYIDEDNKEHRDYYDSGKYYKDYLENKKKFEQEFGQIYLTFLTIENDLDEFLEIVNKKYNKIKVLGNKINEFKNMQKEVTNIISEFNFNFLLEQLDIFRELRNELSHSTIYYHLIEEFFFLYPQKKRMVLYPKESIGIIENKQILKLNENYLNHIAKFSVNLGIDKKRKRNIDLFTNEKSENPLYGIGDLKNIIKKNYTQQRTEAINK